MGTAATLRIGICGCTTKYHGRIQGRRVAIRRLGKSRLPHPITFRLREFPIPEDDQQTSLRLFRCHAFLDVHREYYWRGSGYAVTLFRQEILRDTLGRERTATHWDPECYRDWLRKKPPSTNTTIRALRELIQGMGKTKFLRWQRQMTPQGWKPPEAPSK